VTIKEVNIKNDKEHYKDVFTRIFVKKLDPKIQHIKRIHPASRHKAHRINKHPSNASKIPKVIRPKPQQDCPLG
jgi:hypothetical protein